MHFCLCGSFLFIFPETQRTSQTFMFSKCLTCLFGWIWNERHLTEIQGYSFCVKDKTKSLSHSLGLTQRIMGISTPDCLRALWSTFLCEYSFIILQRHIPPVYLWLSLIPALNLFQNDFVQDVLPFVEMRRATQNASCFVSHLIGEINSSMPFILHEYSY